MNKLKIISIFAVGALVHELLVHAWFILDDMMPFTSKTFFNFTLTREINTIAMIVDALLLVFFLYLVWKIK
ncbi:MAG: hypothetical protein NUV69_02005 [Candidatus Curtissbacteria bacterium]|nr:hypothetical protein [Candidatus Curtissbacteria bacterium]